MQKFIDHCCEKCTHTRENPCKDFIHCCIDGPICHENPSCSLKRQDIIKKVALNDRFVIC